MPPKKNSRSQSATTDDVVPVRLVCPVCMEVPEKVMLTDDCGHLLCESCTNKILAKDDILCPVCQQAFSRDSVHHSVFLQREINALPIVCPSEGCDWKKERSELASHLKQCPEAVIPCPHAEEGCTATMKRKEVESHSVDCEAAVVPCLNVIDGCRENMKRKDMGTHIDVCQFQTISCPNEGCDAKNLRKDADDHQDECPEAMVRCAHAEDGCKAKMKRKNLEEHMEANKFEHLQLQVKGNLKKVTLLEARLHKIEQHLQSQRQCVVKVPIKGKDRSSSEDILMAGERWGLTSEIEGEYRSMYLYIRSKTMFDGIFSLKVLSMREKGVDITKSSTSPTHLSRNWGWGDFIPLKDVDSYVKNGCLYVEVTMKYLETADE